VVPRTAYSRAAPSSCPRAASLDRQLPHPRCHPPRRLAVSLGSYPIQHIFVPRGRILWSLRLLFAHHLIDCRLARLPSSSHVWLAHSPTKLHVLLQQGSLRPEAAQCTPSAEALSRHSAAPSNQTSALRSGCCKHRTPPPFPSHCTRCI